MNPLNIHDTPTLESIREKAKTVHGQNTYDYAEVALLLKERDELELRLRTSEGVEFRREYIPRFSSAPEMEKDFKASQEADAEENFEEGL